MAWAPRGFEWVRNSDGLKPEFYDTLFTASASRGVAITPNQFAVAEADGTVDGVTGSDTQNASGVRIKGYIVGVYDSTGQKALDNPYVATSAACKVRLMKVRAGDIFRAVVDAEPTSTSVGSMPLVAGTATSYSSDDTVYPNPENNDKLDGSEYHATITQHAFQIVGLDPDVRNVENAASAKVVLVKVNSTWRTD